MLVQFSCMHAKKTQGQRLNRWRSHNLLTRDFSFRLTVHTIHCNWSQLLKKTIEKKKLTIRGIHTVKLQTSPLLTWLIA